MPSSDGYSDIPTLQDCIALVAKEPAFCHTTYDYEGEIIHSFKYNLHRKGMWEHRYALNMRGITFDGNGKLLALPFPKFFNVGETGMGHDLVFSEIKGIREKIDGSLISMFMINGEVYPKTQKCPISKVSLEAREYLYQREDVRSFSKTLIQQGYTPLFEYTSPSQKIVLTYPEEFFYLGCRDMRSGEILAPQDCPSSIKRPRLIKTEEEVQRYLNREDIEGVVIELNDGKMLKMKAKHYIEAHAIVTELRPKIVVKKIIDNNLDDTKGFLAQNGFVDELDKVCQIEQKFWDLYDALFMEAKNYLDQYKHLTPAKLADQIKEDNVEALIKGLVFKLYNKKEFRSMLNDHIYRKYLSDLDV